MFLVFENTGSVSDNIPGKFQFGNVPHAQKRAEKYWGGKLKWKSVDNEWHGFQDGKKKFTITHVMDNPTTKAGRFTKKHIAALKKQYAKIRGIDPAQPTYKKLTEMLDGLTQPQLKQLSAAKIKFVSGLASNRIKRSANPVRKKKRSAKQLANDKRLGRMAKARAKAKRGGARKKPARKKVARKKVARKANPKRRVVRKSPLWILFRCNGSNVHFYNGGWPISQQWGNRNKAALFRSRGHASATAEKLGSKGARGYVYGAAPENTTAAKIREHCEYESGKG